MATITIDLTPTQTSRVAAAFGSAHNLGRDATGPEIRQYLINFMTSVVTDKERSAQINAIVVPDLGIT